MIPYNEQSTITLFARLADELEYEFKEIGTRCPDAILIKDGREVRAEFEYASLNFKKHGHDPNSADLIICWLDNWKDCPLPVLSLEKYVVLAKVKGQVPRWHRRLDLLTAIRIKISNCLLEIKKNVKKNRGIVFCLMCGETMNTLCHYENQTPLLSEDGSYSRNGYAEHKCPKCKFTKGEDIYDNY